MTASPIIGQVLGHYRIVEQIGAGGMGIVYRAHDLQLQRDVAVKVLHPWTLSADSSRSRFRQEALALGRLNHPNIAAAFDFGTQNGKDFLVLEYIPGISLEEHLMNGALPDSQVLELGIQLARGLEAAHCHRIIHRDLKPANLRLKPDGTLKILDFGLAKIIQPQRDTDKTTTIGHSLAFKGTIPYMSPEQLRGEIGDERSDIWAVGTILYEMACGKRAFPQQQSTELIDAIRYEEPARPSALNSRVSLSLENAILTALDKHPERRYRSATEIREHLAAIAAGQVTTVTVHRPIVPHSEAIWYKQRFVQVAATLLVLGCVVTFLGYRHFGQARPVPQRVLAVLPFDAVAHDSATDALGHGLTETISAKLVQASTTDMIQVVSPRDLREQGVKTADQARREFGTDFVLEGTLERSGDMIRVNCYLVDSRTRRQLGARTVTVPASDSFGLEDAVVSQVLDLLPTGITEASRQAFFVPRDTKPAAYEAYVRGRGYLQEYERPEGIDNAIGEFQQAIRIDATYAPAYARLGEAYWVGFQQLGKGKEWLSKASLNCEKALALAPNLAEGHSCLGNISYEKGKYEQATAQFERALQLDSTSDASLVGLADAYGKLGKIEEAEATYKKAVALRPKYWGVYSWLGAFYYTQFRYEDAAQAFRKVTELAPDNYRGYSNLSAMYVLQGRYEEAIRTAKHSIQLRPNSDAVGNLAFAFFLLHRFPEAVENCRQAIALNDADYLNWGNLGDALYWTPGHRSEAATAYSKAIALAKSQLEINPSDFLSWIYVAEYSAMIEDRETAMQHARRALLLAPRNPEVLFRCAMVHQHLGDTRLSLDYLRQAISGGWPRTVVRDTPDFAGLGTNPEFVELVKTK